ncbi:MAG: hypothetical protein ACJAWT_000586 [Glaciecola sp.]|jgi:hypothetical protein
MNIQKRLFYNLCRPLQFMALLMLMVTLSSCTLFTGASSDSGQCWSRNGGVGNLLKNSSTKAECEELGGKSWCPVGGGCESI